MRAKAKLIDVVIVTRAGVRSTSIENTMEDHRRAVGGGDFLPMPVSGPGLDKVIAYRAARTHAGLGPTMVLDGEPVTGPILFVGSGRNGDSRALTKPEAALAIAWATSQVKEVKAREAAWEREAESRASAPPAAPASHGTPPAKPQTPPAEDDALVSAEAEKFLRAGLAALTDPEALRLQATWDGDVFMRLGELIADRVAGPDDERCGRCDS